MDSPMRQLLAFLAALTLLLSGLSAFVQVAGAQSTGTMTVHARYCPPGEIPDDPFGTCHDLLLNGFDISVDSDSPTGTTGADGNLSTTGLAAGDHSLFVEIPLKGTTYSVFCTVVGGDGTFLDLGSADPGVTVPVEGGQEVICDWYWLISDEPLAGPEDQLTIHARGCPVDEIPDDFFATCHDTPLENVEYFDGATSIGTTNTSGNLVAVFESAGTVQLNGGAPGEFASNFIYCSSDADQSTLVDLVEVIAGTSVDVPVDADGTTCDWYIVPEDLRGETPTPAPTATAGPVTQLPNTGAGSTPGNGLEIAGIMALILAAFSTLMVARRTVRHSI